MKALFILSFALWFALAPAYAGSITGLVRAEGKAEAAKDADCGKYDSREFKFAERVDYASMHDFVVYIDQPVGTNQPVAPAKPIQVVTAKKEVSQKGAMFNPHVLPVVVGSTVEWPNRDDIFHNVFSISESNPFDLGLYKDPEVKLWKFNTVGRVDVFCSIHSSMNCIVLVLPNTYYAATNKKGVYTITNVPAGTYKVKAWHERMPSDIREITVPENGEVKVDFTLGIKNLPKT